METFYTIFETKWGWMGISYTEVGLLALTLPKKSAEEAVLALERESRRGLKPGGAYRERLQEKFEAYFSGRVVCFDEPLDLSRATPFQREVWKVLQAIPYGQRRSYQEVAQAIGRPTATRAVGRAVGSNPLPIIIPCHRVIRQNGSLGGFSAGLGWKRRLLAIEGTCINIESLKRGSHGL